MTSVWSDRTHPTVAFLDRDGTVIVERDYLKDPGLVALERGAAAGLRRFQAAGIALVVVTNQSGIGRGRLTEADYALVTARMIELLAAAGVRLHGIYHCPHAPEAGCDCRKPARGLVDRAARDLAILPERGVVIGDKASDMALATTIGARSILVTTGYGARTHAERPVAGDAVVPDLTAAADLLGLAPAA